MSDVEYHTDSDLVALPSQHPIVPWPADEWARGRVTDAIDPRGLARLTDMGFSDPEGPIGATNAFVVAHHGQIIFEKYREGFDATSTHISWSVAKSILHGFLGTLVADGTIDIDQPLASGPIPEWSGDDRAAITLRHLLMMRSGLRWVEDYTDDSISHVIEMLFGSGQPDHCAYARDMDLVAMPGEQWTYSSGTSNIVARVVADAAGVASEAEYREALAERLFNPLSMSSPNPGFDASGNWVASSYVHATAEDFLRFGHLYLRDGVWKNKRLLPAGWVDLARTSHALDEGNGLGYGHHWWTVPDDFGSFTATGYDGQRIQVVPAMDLVFVRFGKTEQDDLPALRQWFGEFVELMRPLAR